MLRLWKASLKNLKIGKFPFPLPTWKFWELFVMKFDSVRKKLFFLGIYRKKIESGTKGAKMPAMKIGLKHERVGLSYKLIIWFFSKWMFARNLGLSCFFSPKFQIFWNKRSSKIRWVIKKYRNRVPVPQFLSKIVPAPVPTALFQESTGTAVLLESAVHTSGRNLGDPGPLFFTRSPGLIYAFMESFWNSPKANDGCEGRPWSAAA